jgi:pyruvate kinase
MQGLAAVDNPRDDLCDLLSEVTALRANVLAEAPALLARWGLAAGAAAPAGLENLADYIALRHHDLSGLQERLAAFGLSSLGHSEARTRVALDALVATLRRLCGDAGASYPPAAAMGEGRAALEAEREKVFGARDGAPRVGVMATLPSEAATDDRMILRLVEAGMDCARINCAHDDPDAWSKMIERTREAARRTGRPCRVLMDVAGPKCRVAEVRAPEKLRLYKNDRVTLAANLDDAPRTGVAFSPTFPEALADLGIGSEVWINDGKIGARVVSRTARSAELEIFSARKKGERLRSGKGLNFPASEIDMPPLTAKDLRDLDIVAAQADIVGFSFVRRASDVERLQDELAARRGAALPAQPIVLKIETPLAVRNLPSLLVQSTARNPTAVMIARGDLAIELGFARLSEMQEEILWLCEAAHVPVIWATQVLDQFVRDGVFIRAEMTDAAMAQRADCVMLNKGPYLAEGVAFLRDILTRMDRDHAKKLPRLASLAAW